MASICDVNGKKPKIEYPNFWQYKVILETTKYERAHIEELLKGEEYKISFSNFSNGGKLVVLMSPCWLIVMKKELRFLIN